MLGIALGVAALITVLSVMNGFQKELRTRILGVASHVQITGADNTLANWPKIAAEAKAQKNVVATAPFVMAQGMFSFDGAVQGAIIRGIEPAFEEKVADIGVNMKSGKLSDLRGGEFNIVLGSELARSLHAFPGDKVVLIAPQGQVTPAGIVPRLKQFKLVGTFESGYFEFDNGLALIHLTDAQKLYRMEDKVSGLRLKLDDLFAAPRVSRELTKMISADAYISDWTRSHANFFKAIDIEKRVMFVILFLIVAVAAFNIVSTLVMVVTDKQSDIAILRTLGASPKSIMQIFMVQGSLIGIFGTLIGVVVGVLLAKNIDVVVPAIEKAFGVAFLDKSVYYISELPSELIWRDVGMIALVSFVLTLLATIYPSWSASRIKPADALRYE